MAAFAQFGSDLDKATQSQLARGERLVEILKQVQYRPLNVANQIVIIYAGVNGFLDKYPTDVLERYESELNEFVDGRYPDLFKALEDKKEIDDDLDGRITKALEEFAEIFTP
jgi:F-type H+-transporting ATPase subunit alpha